MNQTNDRRNFLLGFGLTAGALALGLGSAVSAVVRALFSGLMEGEAFNAGKAADFETGKVDARWKQKHGVWIIRSLDGIFALSAVSPYGCEPAWIEKEQKFHCACHNKDYYKSGISFEGAAGKSLERVKIASSAGRDILITPGKKFLMHDGGWQRPHSILPV
jgi:hypothetical protein